MPPRARPAPLQYEKGQRDLVTAMVPHCPTCGGPWKAAKRVCRKCGQSIGGNHKWHWVPASPGLWAFEHWDCESPTTKPKASESKP